MGHLNVERLAVLMIVLSVIAITLLVYAALHDFAARTVPNWLPLCVFAIGLISRIADHSLLPALLIAGVTFLILFGIWFAGAIGGGDVKLWAATALLIPPHWQPELSFFLRVVIIGGILALAYLLLCLCLPKPRASREGGLFRRVLRVEAWRIGRRGPLPYAFAIAGSAIITLLPLSVPALR